MPTPPHLHPRKLTAAQKALRKQLSDQADLEIQHTPLPTLRSTLSTGTHLIFFGAHWCPYTQTFTPKWLQLQTYFSNQTHLLRMSKVECSVDEDGCMEGWGVDGYPTVFLFVEGEKKEEMDVHEVEGGIEWIQERLGRIQAAQGKGDEKKGESPPPPPPPPSIPPAAVVEQAKEEEAEEEEELPEDAPGKVIEDHGKHRIVTPSPPLPPLRPPQAPPAPPLLLTDTGNEPEEKAGGTYVYLILFPLMGLVLLLLLRAIQRRRLRYGRYKKANDKEEGRF
ncbi:Thioredoxin domain-containing protein 5 [Chytridiales sp. JEL 0842]|nr:Thioredoxin domain-containing protein 5 [Chytridiales sp. JEL 0842]